MPEPRLQRTAPQLVEVLRQAQPDQRRQASLSACRVALNARPYDHPAVDRGLALLAQPLGRADDELLGTLRGLFRRLDAAPGRRRDDTTSDAFGQARAIQSLWFALRGDSFESTCEAIYEAQAASGSPRNIQVAVMTAVRG